MSGPTQPLTWNFNTIVTFPEVTQFNTIEMAQNKLVEFFESYPETTYVDSTLESDLVGYDWSETLTMHFDVQFEGEDKPTRVEVVWSEGGCSCTEFGAFYSVPTFTPTCLPQLHKWYRLDDNRKTALDIAIETNHANEVKEILEKTYTDKIDNLDFQVKSLTYQLNILQDQNKKLQDSWCTIL